MVARIKHTFSLLAVLALFNLAATAGLGQSLGSTPQVPQSAATVTAASSGDGLRFSAPGNITHIRLEVFSSSGERVFDSGNRDGNVFDWRWQDEKASAFSADSYLCVVTVQSLSGKTTRKLANVSFANQQASLQPVEVTQLTLVQAQALSATETDTPLTIIGGQQSIAASVLAHDGNDGQVTRTRGAFTFRVGDFFSGNDKEQMRLTEQGNLGIGIAKPKAKLDVAGTVRAREGFQFADGSNLNVNDKGALTLTNSNGIISSNVSGTGTQNRLAKWTDNAGTLGDSIASDTGTGLQLTAAPSGVVDTNLIYLNATNGTIGVLAGSTPSFGANNGPFFAMRGNTYTTIGNQRGLFTIAAGNVSSPVGDDGSVKFNTGNDLLRMVIRPSGNVGIGVPAPGALLDVGGNINTSTQYNIGGSRILSNAGHSNLFAGVGAGGSNTGSNNSFFGANAGASNTIGLANAFFGTDTGNRNTIGDVNSFFGKEAGNNNTEGNGNSFFGYSAGSFNSTGSDNAFFGRRAGDAINGDFNSFFGSSAGFNTTGGMHNTLIGFSADGAAGISNATAIGSQAQVTQNNSLVLGSINGVNGASADTKVGIGTTAPGSSLHVNVPGSPNPISAVSIDVQSFGNPSNAVASHFLRVRDIGSGSPSSFLIRGDGNVGIGTDAPNAKLQVQNGDVYVGTGGNGMILKSPNGAVCRRLTIDNSGNLLSASVTCP